MTNKEEYQVKVIRINKTPNGYILLRLELQYKNKSVLSYNEILNPLDESIETTIKNTVVKWGQKAALRHVSLSKESNLKRFVNKIYSINLPKEARVPPGDY